MELAARVFTLVSVILFQCAHIVDERGGAVLNGEGVAITPGLGVEDLHTSRGSVRHRGEPGQLVQR